MCREGRTSHGYSRRRPSATPTDQNRSRTEPDERGVEGWTLPDHLYNWGPLPIQIVEQGGFPPIVVDEF